MATRSRPTPSSGARSRPQPTGPHRTAANASVTCCSFRDEDRHGRVRPSVLMIKGPSSIRFSGLASGRTHLLCGHPPALVDEPELGQLLFPDLGPGTLRHVLRRAAYSGDKEREAELLASLILERVGGGMRRDAPSPALAPEAAALLDRLGAVLEEGGGARRAYR